MVLFVFSRPTRKQENRKTSLPKVIWEQLRRHPSRQRMDSPAACVGCTVLTADESKSLSRRYAASTLQCHMLFICYIALSDLPPNQALYVGIFTSTGKQESCAIAKMSARCTIRQYAHSLKLESPFVPSSTDCWAVRAKIRQ